MKTCETCKANKVCDHNRFGFENCGNYISADVVPRAMIAEIFEGIAEIFNKRIAFYTDMAKQSKFTEKHYAETMIKNCEIYLQEIAELKKKCTKEGGE